MLQYFSPAKINFFFHVIDKRSDGYHEIVSLLHTVSFGDYIHFAPAQTDQLTIEGNPELPSDDTNLVIQALKLFRNKTGWIQPFHIHLQKNIPLGSGLGGGSSNAATTLWALNDLSKLGIAKDQLQKWSSELGSDVPFFFSSGCAVCRGRGEIVEDKPAIIEREIYLILNEEPVNTKKVFSEVIPSKEKIDIPTLIADTLEKKYPCINELEQSAFRVYPSLFDRKREISAHCTGSVFMTGSGGSFVVIGRPQEDLFSQYPVIKKVQCIEILQKGWYKDRKIMISELQSKINALKNILPKEMSVQGIPDISLNAYELYMYYCHRMLEHAEASYDNLLNNREISCENSVRSVLEVDILLKMFLAKINESIAIKELNKIYKFLNRAICGTKYDHSPTKPIHISEALRERKKTGLDWECVYDCYSEFAHPNGIGMANYISAPDRKTQMIYFGRSDTIFNLDIIIYLLKHLEDLISSYYTHIRLLDDFKSLCIEKKQIMTRL